MQDTQSLEMTQATLLFGFTGRETAFMICPSDGWNAPSFALSGQQALSFPHHSKRASDWNHRRRPLRRAPLFLADAAALHRRRVAFAAELAVPNRSSLVTKVIRSANESNAGDFLHDTIKTIAAWRML